MSSASRLGVGGFVRHRRQQFVTGPAQHIATPAIRRLARRGGCKRVSALIYEQTRDILRTFLQSVVGDSVVLADSAQRKTVQAHDVLAALVIRGHKLYGYDVFSKEAVRTTSKSKRSHRQALHVESAAVELVSKDIEDRDSPNLHLDSGNQRVATVLLDLNLPSTQFLNAARQLVAQQGVDVGDMVWNSEFANNNETVVLDANILVIELHNRDIDTLIQPDGWLNDNIVMSFCQVLYSWATSSGQTQRWAYLDSQTSQISDDARLVRADRSLNPAQPDEQRSWLDYDAVYAPINVNKNHWILAVFAPNVSEVRVYDSLQHSHSYPELSRLIEHLGSIRLGANLTVTFPACQKQTDSASCGVFVLAYLSRLARKNEVDLPQNQVTTATEARSDILKTLISGSVKYVL